MRQKNFDEIADRIIDRRPITALLIVRSSDGTVAGCLRLEGWILQKGYTKIIKNSELYYLPKTTPPLAS